MNLHSCGGAVGVVSLALHSAVGAGPNNTWFGPQWFQVEFFEIILGLEKKKSRQIQQCEKNIFN